MLLTRIDPKDFVFNNDDLSISCWRDENGNPVGDTETTPNFLDSGTVNGVNSYYLGNPANLQFSRAVANKNTPLTAFSRKIYGAIRNIVYGDKNAIFEWGGSEETLLYVISISKNCLKSSLLPGSLRIGNYTDDSNINPPRILNCGRAYNLVTGTTFPGGGFSYGSGTSISGLFLPDVGLIISSVPLSPSTFVLSTENPTPSNHVFIRAQNTQYNYSMNPSFISGSSGYIINQDWFDNPQTYITTVGLYNDNNELMATAKLPRPYNKNFNNELLMQIGLNF
jgi:hypothetical protein